MQNGPVTTKDRLTHCQNAHKKSPIAQVTTAGRCFQPAALSTKQLAKWHFEIELRAFSRYAPMIVVCNGKIAYKRDLRVPTSGSPCAKMPINYLP